MAQLQDELYRSMEAHLETENQPQQSANVDVEQMMEEQKGGHKTDLNTLMGKGGEQNEPEKGFRLTLDHWLVDMSEEDLNDFFKTSYTEILDEKPDGTVEEITEEFARNRWAYLQKKKKADPFLRSRLPSGEPLGMAKFGSQKHDPRKQTEVPMKPSAQWLQSKLQQTDETLRSNEPGVSTGGANADSGVTKKFDPNILSSIKHREEIVKQTLESTVANKASLQDTLEQLSSKEKKKFRIGNYIPLLRSQRNRNIAQASALTLFAVGYLFYYMSNEEWHPKRVTNEDMSVTLREIRELRESYNQKQGGLMVKDSV
eukprot:CAMPEP_0117445816 /NCGR_PEP_ID=MMETSP0759-20121206/5999_1 /TAXON_ID=63605 /ORGANISM="Percolomonas cosmopolitus, Strain WS" /LENGTH=314 /DNA_ID=CAMNT_0005238021 /DNA_START=213 /DNA_END=1154 /DNA_ORIENTATION=+